MTRVYVDPDSLAPHIMRLLVRAQGYAVEPDVAAADVYIACSRDGLLVLPGGRATNYSEVELQDRVLGVSRSIRRMLAPRPGVPS